MLVLVFFNNERERIDVMRKEARIITKLSADRSDSFEFKILSFVYFLISLVKLV